MNKHLSLSDPSSLQLGRPSSIQPRVLELHYTSEGKIEFNELCDEYFQVVVSPTEAIEILNNMLTQVTAWSNNQP